MEISESKVFVDPRTLIFDPKNKNIHSEADLAPVKRLLEKFGQVEPLVVRKSTNVVMAGNGRLKSILELGWDKVWVHYWEGSDEEFEAFALALNQSGRNSDLDYTSISALMDHLKVNDVDLLHLTGFTDSYIAQVLAVPVPIETAPVEVAPPPARKARGVSVVFGVETRPTLEAAYEVVRASEGNFGLTPAECLLKIVAQYLENAGNSFA